MRQVIGGEKKVSSTQSVYRKLLSEEDARSFIVPRYAELTVEKIWEKVKEVSSLMFYFPDYLSGQNPERDYLIAIISTTNPEATKEIISEAREKRSLQTVDELDNLVKITPEFKELIRSTVPHKSNSSLLSIL